MEIQLFIHNLGYIAVAFLSVILAVLIYIRGRRKLPNILFSLTSLSFVLYILFYLKGVNESDPALSQFYLSFTLIITLTVCLSAHLAFAMFNKLREQKRALQIIYTAGLALILFFAFNTNAYLLPSAPHDYLPNFFVIGNYYWIFTIYFFSVALYFFGTVIVWYIKAESVLKNRMKYFLLAFGWIYGVGAVVFATIFGLVDVNMLYTSVMGLYMIPMAYGVFKYDVIDINVAAKNALLYAFYSLVVGVAIVIVNIFNNYMAQAYTGFPLWLLPFLSGVFVVFVSWVIWRQIREADILKYEFINNISHKFRTPLTHIRWLAEDLRDVSNEADRAKAVEQIQFASMRLFELTNVVIDASQTTNDLYLYHFTSVKIQDLVKEIDGSHKDQTEHKNLKVHVDIGPDVPQIKADKTRLQFALQILYENALIYTPTDGSVDIKVRQIGGEVIISIRDTGIGISEEDLPHVFSKFYRSQNARHADTEGMGIGLFMAKNIIEKHNGRIWAESYGENKGSIFSVALPIN